ncbi:MAG TPA: cytochrome c oxidase subunit 3 [Pyrinomonadaceae bacterium]|jgi:cytochrome c oxidase subunit 3|nr:cytochrome c oxidase subunit 3 [Pyrinomonadaceae bacterium]
MAVTVTGDREAVAQRETALGVASTRSKRGGRGNGRGPGGGGPNGPGGPGGGGGDGPRQFSPERYRIGVLVGLASILMMFTALASAYVVRSGMPTSTDWRGGQMPTFVYLSTGLILLSSLTFTRAKSALGHKELAGYRLWLGVTLLLGLGFLASQVLAWRELVGRGLYLATNPHSSFFYVLTGLHGLHLAGGILALALLYAYARRAGSAGENVDADLKRRTLTDVVGIYWHFMDALWVFLFLLLLLWR